MSMTSESEEQMMTNAGMGSSSTEEASGGGNVGGSGPQKKGPWTSAEDAILIEYVTKHGEGNWNAVQKHSGLARCGKSCRLRWANHLRPDLKKGAFTPDEELAIIKLHAKLGNKWARMATELPGRTDNEIKNYWNTRIKRRQRAGLPIYPPEICPQPFSENQPNENISAFSSGNPQHHDVLSINGFEMPASEFNNMKHNHQILTPFFDLPHRSLLGMPGSTLLAQGLNSSYDNKNLLTVHASKRPRQYESYPGSTSNFTSAFPDFGKYHNDGSPQTLQSFGFSSAYDDPISDHPSSAFAFPGSHALINGNFSSEPLWAIKQELPSLQTQMDTWGSPPSPLPSLESADNLIQSHPNEQKQSRSLSREKDGLLESVIHESHSMKIMKNSPCQQMSSASVAPGEIMDSSSPAHQETEWGTYGEPISPLGHSSASVFSKCTPISASSSDEHQSYDTFQGKESKLN